MSDYSSLIDAINAKMGKIIINSTGIGAATATVIPAQKYGPFLTSNGYLALSYAEWLQVLAGIWVLVLILNSAKNGLFSIIRFTKSKKKRKLLTNNK